MNIRHRRKVAFRLVVVLLALLTGLAPDCLHAEEHKPLPDRRNALIPVNIGIDAAGILQREVGLQNIQAAWDVWYEGLGKTYGISLKTIFYEDYLTLIQDFNAGKLDMVSTNALNYLRMAPQIETNWDPDIYGVISEGQKTYRYLVLARSHSGISDLKDLQGKTLILRQGDQTGQLYLNTLLLSNGLSELEQFFLEIQETESFSKAGLSVFFQKADVCLIMEATFEIMIELNPQVGKQLRILDRSPELANGVFFFYRHLSQDIKDILVKRILNLETSVSGRQILMLYKIDRLIQFELSDLDSVKALLQEYKRRTQQ